MELAGDHHEVSGTKLQAYPLLLAWGGVSLL